MAIRRKLANWIGAKRPNPSAMLRGADDAALAACSQKSESWARVGRLIISRTNRSRSSARCHAINSVKSLADGISDLTSKPDAAEEYAEPLNLMNFLNPFELLNL